MKEVIVIFLALFFTIVNAAPRVSRKGYWTIIENYVADDDLAAVPVGESEHIEGDMTLNTAQKKSVSEDGDHFKRDMILNTAQQKSVGEEGDHFEGDMILNTAQKKALSEPEQSEESRNGLIDITKRWPNRTVVYNIQEADFDKEQLHKIEVALEDIANKSCIKFRRRQGEEHAVLIQGTDGGCYSSVGLVNPNESHTQVLNLAKGCFKHGTIVHEMLHTLGFYHMQSTYDRDEFVKIVWENIDEDKASNFNKYGTDRITDFGVPYDYGSVMHYPETAFSTNGNKTIIPLQDNVKIGQREGLSKADLLKLNRMYCEELDSTVITTTDKFVILQ